ncbi:hypothetical protein MARINOS108_120424 [Marinoscillum sp. 108]|nr:hypothetical protein MARINOS108_120424 [Marinoscillum sp. 108]
MRFKFNACILHGGVPSLTIEGNLMDRKLRIGYRNNELLIRFKTLNQTPFSE